MTVTLMMAGLIVFALLASAANAMPSRGPLTDGVSFGKGASGEVQRFILLHDEALVRWPC